MRLSAERVWSEVKRILMADDPRLALGLMEETGVLALVMPQADVGAAGGLAGARGAGGCAVAGERRVRREIPALMRNGGG